MSSEELVGAYLRGEISRRIFVRRLVAAGITLSAAISYSQLLNPERASAQTQADLYDHYDVYSEDVPPPPPPPVEAAVTPAEKVPAQTADVTAPATRLRLSRLRLAAVLATGRMRLSVSTAEPVNLSIGAYVTAAGRRAQADRLVRIGLVSRFLPRPGVHVVTLRVSRRGRRLLASRRRKALVTLVLQARDAAGNLTRRTSRVRLGR